MPRIAEITTHLAHRVSKNDVATEVLGHDKRSAFFKLERLMPSAGQFDAVPPSDVALAIAVIARGSCGAIHTYSDAVGTARSDSRDVGPALNIALSEIIPACG